MLTHVNFPTLYMADPHHGRLIQPNSGSMGPKKSKTSLSIQPVLAQLAIVTNKQTHWSHYVCKNSVLLCDVALKLHFIITVNFTGLAFGISRVINTHTRLTALFSGTIWVSWYQRGKTNLDFTEAKRRWVTVISAGLYATLHLAPDR